MEESTGKGGWPILKRKHGDATNFQPAGVVLVVLAIVVVAILTEVKEILSNLSLCVLRLLGRQMQHLFLSLAPKHFR